MKLPNITLSSEVLSRFSKAIQKEWLITNGLGGYSSSTVLGLNTRKYHGLLVAALRPPRVRTVCLAKLDEDLISGDTIYRLGANEFHGVIYPQGYTFLKEFTVSPFPTFTYQTQDVTVKKTIFMPQRKNLVVAMYNVANRNNRDYKLRIYPLMTCRLFHTTVNPDRKQLIFRQEINDCKIKLVFSAPNASVVSYASAGAFVERPNWVNSVHYHEENVRGELDVDDIYQPGYYEFSVAPQNETRFAIVAAADEKSQAAEALLNSVGSSIFDFDQLFMHALSERSDFLDTFYNAHEMVNPNSWLNWILLATDSFITKEDDNRRSIIAGYHWFETWGRDTFISLPGLLLVTGRISEAKFVLQSYIRYYKKGLIPNLIEDASGEPVYNTVDGTLFYVNAILQYLKYTGDFQFVKESLWAVLKSIVEQHEIGTVFGIQLTSDGLISHDERLTWMDAKVDGKAITPRAGKAVEIQALWYNTLKIMALLAEKFNETSLTEKYKSLADNTKKSFNEKFWDNKKACLYDVLEKNGADSSLRPNQVLACSLDFTMLDTEKSRAVMDMVRQEFLTPYGLRTLARSDPRYKSIYKGSMHVRDKSYHNGTVWPWLLGPFITGYMKAWGSTGQNLEYAMKTFLPAFFENQIYEGCLGTINEIFDGDEPHKPRGCIAQAWSIADPLRAYVEDILQVRPKYEKAVLKFSL